MSPRTPTRLAAVVLALISVAGTAACGGTQDTAHVRTVERNLNPTEHQGLRPPDDRQGRWLNPSEHRGLDDVDTDAPVINPNEHLGLRRDA